MGPSSSVIYIVPMINVFVKSTKISTTVHLMLLMKLELSGTDSTDHSTNNYYGTLINTVMHPVNNFSQVTSV